VVSYYIVFTASAFKNLSSYISLFTDKTTLPGFFDYQVNTGMYGFESVIKIKDDY